MPQQQYKEQNHDLNLKYEATYVSMLDNGVQIPVWIQRIEEGYIYGKRLINDKWRETGGEIEITDPALNLEFPRVGVLNLKHAPIIIRRIAKRQWRKVLVGGVVQLHDPFYDERERYHLPQIVGVENDSVLTAIFNPTYPSRKEAWEQIASGDKLGVAITPEWFLGVKTHAEGVMLFKDDLSVGIVKEEGLVKIYPEANLLREQVIGLGYKVEAA